VLVGQAFDSMHSLSVDLHYRSCEGGIGPPAPTAAAEGTSDDRAGY
jgi:hypothetical protein